MNKPSRRDLAAGHVTRIQIRKVAQELEVVIGGLGIYQRCDPCVPGVVDNDIRSQMAQLRDGGRFFMAQQIWTSTDCCQGQECRQDQRVERASWGFSGDESR